MGQNLHSYTDKGKHISQKQNEKVCLEFLASKDDMFYTSQEKTSMCFQANLYDASKLMPHFEGNTFTI